MNNPSFLDQDQGRIRVERNRKLHTVDIRFAAPSSASVRQALEDRGFEWHPRLGVWRAPYDEARWEFAINLTDSQTPPQATPAWTPQEFIADLCRLVQPVLPTWERATVTVGLLPTGSHCLVILESLPGLDREYNLTLALNLRREQQMLLEVTVIGLTPDESGHRPVDRREWRCWTIQPGHSRPAAFVHYVVQAIITARQAVIDGTILPY